MIKVILLYAHRKKEKIVSDSVKEWQLKVYELEHSEEYQNADEKQRMVMLRSLIKEDME